MQYDFGSTDEGYEVDKTWGATHWGQGGDHAMTTNALSWTTSKVAGAVRRVECGVHGRLGE